MRFYNYEEFNPKLKLLIDRFDTIKQEYDQNKHNIEWTIPPQLTEKLSDRAGWHIAAMLGTFFSKDGSLVIGKNANLLPTLRDTIIETKETKRVGLLKLEPETVLDWHRDHEKQKDLNTNTHSIIRALLGLDIPNEEGKSSFLEIETKKGIERKIFEHKSIMMFDGEINHRAVNEYSKERVVFVFDLCIEKDRL